MHLVFLNTRGVLYLNTQPNGLGYARGICFNRSPYMVPDFQNTHEPLFP